MNGKDFIDMMNGMKNGERLGLYFRERDMHASLLREPDGGFWILTFGSCLSFVIDRISDVYGDAVLSLYNKDTFIGNLNALEVEFGRVM